MAESVIVKNKTIIPQGKFYLEATINGVILKKSHIESFEEGYKEMEKLKTVASSITLQQHYMMETDNRGMWIPEAVYYSGDSKVTIYK